MSPGDGRPNSAASDAAAQALGVLVPPLRFAARDGWAGLARLTGFGQTIQGAVARARAAGAIDSPALRGLEVEGAGFDALPATERRRAAGRLAVHLASLVPVPEDIAEIARAARAGLLGKGSQAVPTGKTTAAPSPRPSPRPSPPRGGGEGTSVVGLDLD